MTPEVAEPPQQTVRPFDVTSAMVLRLALPMTLAYLTTPVLGLVDTAVVGRLDDAALIGGLAVGAVIMDLVFATFNFQRSGTTGLAAQAVGAQDANAVRDVLLRALAVSLIAGLILFASSPLLLWAAMKLMAPGPAVAAAATSYFLYRIIGAPFALANYAILGWLTGLGRTGLALLVQLILNGCNIALSIWLGLSLGWGIAGVAIATVISEALASAIGLVICHRVMGRWNLPPLSVIFDPAQLLKLANLNADIMLRSFLLLLAFAVFTMQGARFGETTLAANAVLMHFFLIGGYFLDGLATAAEQVIGRSIGARYRPAFLRGLWLTLFWDSLLAAGLSLFFLVWGNSVVALITTLEEVRTTAALWLAYAALTPLSGVLAFLMDGVFIGATWSRTMSRMMLLSFAAYCLALLLLAQPYANAGLWLSLHVFLLVRGLSLALRVRPLLSTSFASVR
ncbi:MAG: MATE family efflux transporter [Nitratireductor sp.]|nr:MATE family efflux transporter [Nitratireductor sp.]